MKITGPLKIGILENDMGGREVHIDFTSEFQAANLQQQIETFRVFIANLAKDIDALEDTNPDKKGMLAIHQIASQMMPHIEANEIPLEETIVVSFETENPFGNIQIQH